MRTMILFLAASLATPALAAELTAGSRCALGEDVGVYGSAKARRRQQVLPAGEVVEILGNAAGRYHLRHGEGEAWAKSAWLEKVCQPQPADDASTAEADSAAARTTAAETPAATPAATPEPPPAPETPAAPPPAPEPLATPTADASATDAARASPPPQSLAAAPAGEPGTPAGPAGGGDDFSTTYKIKVAVMDFGVAGDRAAELAGPLAQGVAQTLEDLRLFKAISRQDILQMLSYDAQQQMLGCDESSCVAEIGGALGADFVITGNLTEVGEGFHIQLQLVEAAEAKVANRVTRRYSGDADGLFDEMAAAAKLLVRDLLGERSGQLRLEISEEGATVSVNGSIVGVSPLPQALTLAGGTHVVAVEKQGFIQYRRDVMIQPDQVTPLAARLRPSADFITAYREEASRERLIGYVTIGAGAAVALAGVGLLVFTQPEADQLEADIAAYNADTTRLTSEHDDLVDRNSRLGAMETAGTVLLGVGAAVTVIGALLHYGSADPDRYDDLESTGVSVVAGPGMVGIRGSFR